jgi:hypothetical protein
MNRLGRWFPGDDHHQMEGLGVWPHHELAGPPLLTALHPFGIGAGVLRHVGRERGENPVREKDPFHAGNLPEGAI